MKGTIALLPLWASLAMPQSLGSAATNNTHRIVDAGVAVEVSFEPAGTPASTASLTEGQECLVRCRVMDAVTRAPVEGLVPAAWFARRNPSPDEAAKPCAAKILSYVAGSPWTAPALALNRFQVIALNDDATITVIDPSSGFGGSKLIGLVTLAGRGSDWVLSPDSRWLWVALPEADQIACIDTFSWVIHSSTTVRPGPERLAIEPGGRAVWTTTANRLIALPSPGNTLDASIELRKGPHEMAFSEDARWLAVRNGQDGSVSVVDPRRRTLKAIIECGKSLESIAYSTASRLLYGAIAEGNCVAAIDLDEGRIVARIESSPGLSQLVAVPASRYLLAVHRESKSMEIIDTSVNRIVGRATVPVCPDSVTTSENAVYVVDNRSEFVTFLPLRELGAGEQVPLLEIPIGQRPKNHELVGCFAANIAPCPQAGEMLMGSRADQAIYLYRPGMAAPAGQFNNYSRTPTAVLAIDRGFKRRAGGVYESLAVLPKSGPYEFAFYLDRPRVTACVDVDISAAVDVADAKEKASAPRVRFRHPVQNCRAGQPLRLEFDLLDEADHALVRPVKDLRSLTVLAPGTWHSRDRAQASEGGGYQVDITPPRPGRYYVYLEAPSVALLTYASPYIVVEATSDATP